MDGILKLKFKQIIDLIGCKDEDIILASAKTRAGIDLILDAVIDRIPAPSGDENAPLQALVFDSIFDSYRGAVAYVRIFNGVIKEKDEIKFFVNDKKYLAEEVGTLRLGRIRTGELKAGNVGYLIAGVKYIHDTKVGDTVTHIKNGAEHSLPGYKEIKPMVFSGLYPTNTDEFENLREAFSVKLHTRNLGCFRIWFPLRISWYAPYGNCSGKTRT